MITAAKAPIRPKISLISAIEYNPAVTSPVLFSRNSTFIKVFYQEFLRQIFHPKRSKFAYQQNKLSPLPNMESELNLSHKFGASNNVQLTVTREMHEHCILLAAPRLIIVLVVSCLNYPDNCVIPKLDSKKFCSIAKCSLRKVLKKALKFLNFPICTVNSQIWPIYG